MILHTASEGITLAKKLESDSAKFYEELARRYTSAADTFLALAKENQKNITQIERTYFGVITDAIEGGYAFNLEADKYKVEASLPPKAGLPDAVSRAVQIEDMIIRFYSEAAEQSQSLMADVPRLFKLIAKKRAERRPKLESLDKKA